MSPLPKGRKLGGYVNIPEENPGTPASPGECPQQHAGLLDQMFEGTYELRYGVVQVLRSWCVSKSSEHALYIGSKGMVRIPLKMTFVELPLVFVVSVLFGWAILIFSSLRVLFPGLAPADPAQEKKQRGCLFYATVVVSLSFWLVGTLSPVLPWLLHVRGLLAEEHSFNLNRGDILHDIVSAKYLSGVEIAVPMLFPFFVGYWCVTHLYEVVVAKQLVYQVAEEFHEMSMYTGVANEHGGAENDLLPAVLGASVDTDGIATLSTTCDSPASPGETVVGEPSTSGYCSRLQAAEGVRASTKGTCPGNIRLTASEMRWTKVTRRRNSMAGYCGRVRMSVNNQSCPEKFSAEWMSDYISEISRCCVQRDGVKIFDEPLVLLDDPKLNVPRDGDEYSEKWARRLTAEATLFKEARLSKWLYALLILYSSVCACTPSVWMRLWYSDTYLYNDMYCLGRASAVVTIGLLWNMSYVTGHACLARLAAFRRQRLQWALLLYLSATDTNRRAMYRAAGRLLKDVCIVAPEIADSPQADGGEDGYQSATSEGYAQQAAGSSTHGHRVSIMAVDPHLRGMRTGRGFGDEQHPDFKCVMEEWTHLVNSMRNRRLENLTFKDVCDLDEAGIKDNAHQVVKDVRIHFESLDPMVFGFVRMWMKVSTTISSKRLENVIPLVFAITLVGIVLCEWSIFFWQYIVCSTVLVLAISMFTLAFSVVAVHHAVSMNAILLDNTVDMLLEWKEALRQQEALKFELIYDQFEVNDIGKARARLHAYFRSLFDQLDHILEQVERTEQPVAFLGVRLTGDWLSRIIAALLTTAALSMWKLISRRETDFVGFAEGHVKMSILKSPN